MYKIIITEQEIEQLVAAFPSPHYGKLKFDNEEYECTPFITIQNHLFLSRSYMSGAELFEYRKKIFTGRSLMQIKKALTDMGLMDATCKYPKANETTSSFYSIKHEFDNICMNRTFSMMLDLTEKMNNISDQFNILIDVLSLNQPK